MGLGGNAGVQSHLDGAEHGLLIVLQHEGEDLHHLPVTPGPLEQIALQVPKGVGQFGKGCSVAQGAGLSLDDRKIVPPVIDWGPKRVGVHLRPRMEEHDMGDSDPRSLFPYVAGELGARDIGFLFVREIWGEDSLLPEMKRRFGGVVICNELMSPADGARLIEAGHADAVAFGRDYIANPDLVERIRQGAELTPADAATFFTHGSFGYDDYLTLSELKAGKVRIVDPAVPPVAEDLGRYSR